MGVIGASASEVYGKAFSFVKLPRYVFGRAGIVLM